MSGLHGQNLKELGSVPFHTDDAASQEDHYQHFGGLEWNPDNRRVSFIYYGTLYLLDVDR